MLWDKQRSSFLVDISLDDPSWSFRSSVSSARNESTAISAGTPVVVACVDSEEHDVEAGSSDSISTLLHVEAHLHSRLEPSASASASTSNLSPILSPMLSPPAQTYSYTILWNVCTPRSSFKCDVSSIPAAGYKERSSWTLALRISKEW
jgi:hypothetical protein